MKKTWFSLIVLILLLAFAAPLFASATQPPAPGSQKWYYKQADDRCVAFGNLQKPNFKYTVSANNFKQPGNFPDYVLDANGNKILNVTCALAPKTKVLNFKTWTYEEVPAVQCFDDSKVDLIQPELNSCRQPWMDYGSKCFDSKAVRIPNCTAAPDPSV